MLRVAPIQNFHVSKEYALRKMTAILVLNGASSEFLPAAAEKFAAAR